MKVGYQKWKKFTPEYLLDELKFSSEIDDNFLRTDSKTFKYGEAINSNMRLSANT